MTRYLLGSNAAADCIFRRRNVHERVKQARAVGHKIGIGMPVLGEIMAGVEFSSTTCPSATPGSSVSSIDRPRTTP